MLYSDVNPPRTTSGFITHGTLAQQAAEEEEQRLQQQLRNRQL